MAPGTPSLRNASASYARPGTWDELRSPHFGNHANRCASRPLCAATQSRSSSDSLEPNGILVTGYDAESAGAARVGVRGIGRLSTMHRYLEATPEPQRLVIGIIDPADLEHG